MADEDVNMSDGDIHSPERTRNKLRGSERERRRSRTRSRGRRGCSSSPERRRSGHLSPRRRSPHSRRRPERGDNWRPRDRSSTIRDRPLATVCTTPSAPQVVSARKLHLDSSERHRKIKSYDNEGDEVVLVSSAQKPKKQRARETFDDYEYSSHQNKRQKPLETPNVDILNHQPVLFFADKSTEGFMGLEDIFSSLPQPTTIKPRKSGSFATQETLLDMTMDQGIHQDRIRRLSDDAYMDADDNDIITSDTFDAPKVRALGPQLSNSNLIPVRDRRWKPKTANPPTPAIPPASLAQDNDGWGVDDWGALDNSINASSSPVTTSSTSAQYEDIFAEQRDGPSMPPPPLSAAPSYSRVPVSPIPHSVSPVVPAGPRRTRQQIYDDYLLECDKIKKEDAERCERQGTIKYQVSNEEVEVILARMSFNAGPVAYATREFWSKPGQSFLKHKEDRRFIPDPANPRLNGKGFPLTQYDEGKTTFDRLLEAQRRAMALIRKTKPGSNEPPLVFRSQKEDIAREAWRKEKTRAKLDSQKAKLNSENSVCKGNARQSVTAAVSSAEKSEIAAIASLSELIDENILADL